MSTNRQSQHAKRGLVEQAIDPNPLPLSNLNLYRESLGSSPWMDRRSPQPRAKRRLSDRPRLAPFSEHWSNPRILVQGDSRGGELDWAPGQTRWEGGEEPDAEDEIHGGTDRDGAAPGRGGYPGGQDHPEAGDQRADVLLLEEEVRWAGRLGAARAESDPGREPPAEDAGGGSVVGQDDPGVAYRNTGSSIWTTRSAHSSAGRTTTTTSDHTAACTIRPRPTSGVAATSSQAQTGSAFRPRSGPETGGGPTGPG